MYEISPGRYRIEIAGEEREIVVSLGLKGELYRLITKKQIEFQKLSFKNLLSVEDKATIKVLADELAEKELATSLSSALKLKEELTEKILDYCNKLSIAIIILLCLFYSGLFAILYI